MFPGGLGKLCGWALQGYLVAGIFGDWALQEYSAVGHCRDTLRAGHCCGWALQEYVAIEHCSQAPGGGRGQHNL